MNWLERLKHRFKVWLAEDTIAELQQILPPDDLASPVEHLLLIKQMRRSLPPDIARLVPFWAVTFCGQEAVITMRHEPLPDLEAAIMLHTAQFLFKSKTACQVVWIFKNGSVKLTTIKIQNGIPQCCMEVINA